MIPLTRVITGNAEADKIPNKCVESSEEARVTEMYEEA